MTSVEYPAVQLAASGGLTPYKWALSSGALPDGIEWPGYVDSWRKMPEAAE